ncbi:acid-thiol ligase [Chondrus crispus]|uniref:Acid-thiol ligase n=1 Tax=Chondrus crispus TaxID=2769 RepID=R7QBS6_CHOCR|nr:acid-thiol ligase [Chondrus crispus]CDF35489.1 acid-thiol ligase [Chondrus crispus]|eukprot:XP_005715308.1 acid-thiol ligase [Chondrus crispus]
MPRASNLFHALRAHAPSRIALTDASGAHTYGALLRRAARLRGALQLPAPGAAGAAGAAPPRVAVLTRPHAGFVAALLAAWAAPAAAVPLSPLYPAAALAPLLEDAAPAAVVAEDATAPLLPPHVRRRALLLEDVRGGEGSADRDGEYAATCDALAARCAQAQRDAAMLLFTSGTTGRAKGVVWRHAMLAYQTRTLCEAWRWSKDDRVVNVLPLHHVHGLVNVVLTALYAGAHVEMHARFEAARVWEAVTRRDERGATVLMAVPAVYARLIEAYEAAGESRQAEMRAGAREVRLFVCGSAGLARRNFEKWESISGQRILERYGMTETGMTLSNAYDDRRQGSLGRPLPGVEMRVRGGGEEGELLVRGEGVFREYWQREDATREAFDEEGWFATGDVVRVEPRGVKMLGRASADIVNTGGYNVSAVEVEEVVREAEGVVDCAVIALPDRVLGEKVVAAVVAGAVGVEGKVAEVAKRLLPAYKRPRRVIVVDELPRNVLGKVRKDQLKVVLAHMEDGERAEGEER